MRTQVRSDTESDLGIEDAVDGTVQDVIDLPRGRLQKELGNSFDTFLVFFAHRRVERVRP